MIRINSMKWGVFVLALLFFPIVSKSIEGEKSRSDIQVYYGVLKTGLMAIGGETTGIGLQNENGLLELSFDKKRELLSLAKSMNDKKVIVEGTIFLYQGVEIPLRRIIMVQMLKADDSDKYRD